MVPNLVDIGPVVLEKKILKFRQSFFFNIAKSSPLEMGRGPTSEQTLIFLTQRCFVTNLVEIGPVVLEKKMKM